jgi:hypothetical protein
MNWCLFFGLLEILSSHTPPAARFRFVVDKKMWYALASGQLGEAQLGR